MGYTNAEAVKSTFGVDKLSENGISEDQINQAIEDGAMQVDIDGVPLKYREYANRLYTCHVLNNGIQTRSTSADGVVMEKVGPLQQQFSSYSGSSRNYGDRWEEMYAKLLVSLGLSSNRVKLF